MDAGTITNTKEKTISWYTHLRTSDQEWDCVPKYD